MAILNTKKRSAHRLPSSSDDEEQDRRPRKAARPAEPSSGEDESPPGSEESSSDEEEDPSSSPARRGHRIDAHHLAQMESTSLYPFAIHSDSSGITGAEFANESNANYGGQASFGIRARLDRWNARVGYETFERVEEEDSEEEDDSEQEGEDGEDENEDGEEDVEDGDEGEDDPASSSLHSGSPFPEIPVSPPSHQQSIDSVRSSDDEIGDNSQGKGTTLPAEREPFGVDGPQYATALAAGRNPRTEDGEWPNYTPEPEGWMASASQTPEENPRPKGESSEEEVGEEDEGGEEDEDSEEDEDGEDEDEVMEDVDGEERSDEEMADGSGDGGEDGEQDGTGQADDVDAGGQQQNDANEGDDRSAGEQDENDHGSQANHPAAQDAPANEHPSEEAGSSNSHTPAQPTVILTPAGGLPNQEFGGRVTRSMARVQRAHAAPLTRGQAYPYITIAESQQAQLRWALYGSEPDSEDED